LIPEESKEDSSVLEVESRRHKIRGKKNRNHLILEKEIPDQLLTTKPKAISEQTYSNKPYKLASN
jgi:hypothetical protein